ncbi:MAG: hypothetical protein ACP5DZ_10355 [Bacteroidales bacterium]
MHGILMVRNVVIVMFLGLFFSCDIINPEEPIPSYIHIDTAMVKPVPGKVTGFHNFQDVWVYVDGRLVGTYQIPFTVPVLPSGQQSITLEAGIKESGQTMYRTKYPFVTSFYKDTLLPPADTLHITPVYEYVEANVPLYESFEDLGTKFENTESSDTSFIIREDSNSIHGKYGYVALDINRPNFDCRTSDLYQLPKNEKIYLEFDYKGNEKIIAGFFAKEYTDGVMSDVRYSVIVLFPSQNWNRIYLNLTEDIAHTTKAIEYRLFFSASKEETEDNEIGEVFLDNIKLIHY